MPRVVWLFQISSIPTLFITNVKKNLTQKNLTHAENFITIYHDLSVFNS